MADISVRAGGNAVPARDSAAGQADGAASGQEGMGSPSDQAGLDASISQGAKHSLLEASVQTEIKITLLTV